MKIASTFVVILFCCISASAQTHQHGAMQSSGDGSFNPFVAPDNHGGFYLAYVERANGSSNLMLRHSVDGKNLSVPVRVNDRDGDATVRNENPPKVFVASNGDVFVCWANEREKWKGDIRFARSTDGGKSFSKAITLNSDGERPPAGHAFQSFAMDKKGRIYAAWIDERNKKAEDRGGEIWIATSDDRGKTFSHDRKILGDVCECCRTNIQVGNDGQLFLSYRTVPAGGPMYRDIMLAKSSDRGATFSVSRVSEDGWEINACPVTGPALCLNQLGRITVVWFTGGGARPGLYFASSTDNGKSFSPRKLLDENQKLGKHAQAVATTKDRILVAWDDVTDQPVLLWGILDLRRGLIQKLGTLSGASYPVVTIADENVAVVAGLKASERKIFFQTETLMTKERSSAKPTGRE